MDYLHLQSNKKYHSVTDNPLFIETTNSTKNQTTLKIPIEPAPKLRLKDYLKLATITNRSKSKSASKRQNTQNTTQISQVSIAISNQKSVSDTKKSLQIMREELKKDVDVCLQRVNQFKELTNKIQRKLGSDEEQYEQLVYLCELHRVVKEGVLGNIEKAKNFMSTHKDTQLNKFTMRANELISHQILSKSSSPVKKSRTILTVKHKNSHQVKQHGTDI